MNDFDPTHRITFTDARGAVTTWEVQLCDSEAPSREEWSSWSDGDCSASWGLSRDDDGVSRWYCEGQASPGGACGTVEVERLLRLEVERDY